MRYATGQFAGMNKVSKKTLRHYRDIGLLLPAGIDPSNGYIYYDDEQLQRMRRIQYLQRLGFSLQEIGLMLDDMATDWPSLIKRHLQRTRFELRRQRHIEKELRTIIARLEKNEEVFTMSEGSVCEDKYRIEVFELDERIEIIGRAVQVPYMEEDEKMKRINDLIYGYFGDDAASQIPHRIEPNLRFGIIAEYDPETKLGIYMMGDAVRSLEEIPEGMRSYTVMPGTYASIVFSAATIDQLTEVALFEAIEHLYSAWLPASDYRTNGFIQLEVYREERFEVPSQPEMEVWIPVLPKE